MAMNIRETLLYGPGNRRFRLALEPLKIRGDLQIHFNLAPLGKSIDVPMESRSKPRFIQQRWMKQVGNRANLSTEFLYQSRTVVNRTSRPRQAFDGGSHGRKLHSLRRQHLAQPGMTLRG